jgi:inosine-uridine nucleoside N-ribohydrolase
MFFKGVFPMKQATKVVLILLLGLLISTAVPGAHAQDERIPAGPRIDVIIDTDAGVDDAVAIAYFLSQKKQPVHLLGITAVAGNTAVENSANNALTLLDTAHVSAPVIVGASQPLSHTLSHMGKLTNGPDGLWFVGAAHPHDISALSHDVPAFYYQMAQQHPGATLIALGPLTNVAQAIRQHPQAMRTFGKIVILGGAKQSGNQTPVSEFNIWQDPDAADIVFKSGIPISLVTLDAFTTMTITEQDIDELRSDGNALARLVVEPLAIYGQVQTGMGGATSISIPDLAGVMYALHPTLGVPQSSLVEVIPAPRLVRGQTIIATAFGEKLTMLAGENEFSDLADRYYSEPGFDLFGAIFAILGRQPDNAQVVLDINEKRMKQWFMRALTDD